MDLTSVLRDEVFKPAVTLLGPGVIASFPYIALAFLTHQELHSIAASHSGAVIGGLILVFVVVGLLMDNIGARIECCLDQALINKDGYGDHLSNWKKYWRVAFQQEPVGHRYLRTIVLKLKFELNTLSSIPFALVGVVWIFTVCLIGAISTVVLSILGVVLGVFMYKEAELSVRLLSDVRREVLKGIGEPPIS